jgi:hypothetical protein
VKISSIWIATLLPDLQKVRQMADWLKNDAYLLAHEERYNDAVESCRACLCAGRVVGDEPIVISHLVRNAVQLVAIDALERVLAQGVADEAVLKEMQTLLELEDKESTWLHSLRGERAGWHVMFEDIRDGRMPLNTLNGMAGPTSARNLFGWIRERFPSTILSDYPEYLQHMTQAVEIARLPLDQQRPKLQAWEETAKTTDNSVIRLAAPALAKVYNAECRSHGNLRTASVAVACERYRLANKAWPKTLDDLVKAKLIKEIPLDPIDGKPLRYRQDKEKIVIYSIGEDEKDDGGNIERDRMAPGIDVGFRLWHPHLRRLQQ